MSRQKTVHFWKFQKIMGKLAWVCPLRRRFFSLLRNSYQLLQAHMSRDTKKQTKIGLKLAVREEFRDVWLLGQFLKAELRAEPCGSIFACDASTEGWAIVDHPSGGGFINDTGLDESPFETVLLRHRTWRLRKQRRFKQRLDHCLSGEICAFRQACSIASRENPGKDIIIYTDNSNVFFTVRKGRSGVYRLNALCRHVLLCEIVFNVRIHVRWCGTDSMPADKYTRDANSVDPFKGPKSERPTKFRGHPTPKRGPARPPTTDRGSRTVLA